MQNECGRANEKKLRDAELLAQGGKVAGSVGSSKAALSAAGKRMPATESVSKPKKEEVQDKKAPMVQTEWTPEQQKCLETGLKTYPSSDPDRWVKIAGDVPGKSKKECIGRYKEIVAAIKAKKAADAK